MQTQLLVYKGPAVHARAALGKLLSLYRSAFFKERDSGVYEVRATAPVFLELSALSDWAVQPA